MASPTDSENFDPHQFAKGRLAVRELFDVLEAYARGMWRYRWRAVLVMWVFSIVGWVAVYALPPVYSASARVFVDAENTLRPLLRGIATSSDVLSEVTVVTREMLSRPNLAEVARITDLDLAAETDEEFEDLLALLQERIHIAGNRDNIYSISFEHPDRAKAIAVVDSLVNIFIEKSLGADRSESGNARTFLQMEINEYEARLTASEDKLARFKRDNVAFMPDQRGDYFSRLQAAEAELESTQSRLGLAQERRSEMVRQLQGEEPVFGIMPSTRPGASGGASVSATKIRELELQLAELRLQYTDRHPRIGQILETIELLKVQQDLEGSSAEASRPSAFTLDSNPLNTNPVYQNMRIQLSNVEVEIASLGAEFRQEKKRVAELKTLVDTVPQVEAELSRLNRDYDVVKSKFGQLLAQLEGAKIGENVEKSIYDVTFRIIDPPYASLKPVGPKRHLLLAGVFVVALGLGGVLTFLLNQFHPVFYTARAVSTTSGVPVLGVVSLLMSPEDMHAKRKDHLYIATAIALLVVSFLAVYLFAEQFSPLVRELARLDS